MVPEDLPAPALPPVDWAQPREEPLAEVERQLERSSQFTQAALDKLVARLAGAEAYITELVGLLKAHGILPPDSLSDEDEEASSPADGLEGVAVWEEPSGEDLAASAAAASGEEHHADDGPEASLQSVHGDAELSESGTQARVTWPGIAFRVDPDNPAPSVAVNCDERMHVCHAVCCKLNFALTPEEVDGGNVKWDLGFPYMIRHGANGYCSHNDTATGRCTNYANRPGVCHRYSCANDPRIWKDFDNMVLNEDWIRANLANQSRIVVGKSLPLMEVKHGL
jgi:Fe-S-cluster containining protein